MQNQTSNSVVLSNKSNMITYKLTQIAIYIVLFALGIFALDIMSNATNVDPVAKLLPVLLILLSLGSLTYVLVTTYLDGKAPPIALTTHIKKKIISYSKGITTYNIRTVEQRWPSSYQVTKRIFDSINEGDEVIVHYNRYSKELSNIEIFDETN